MTTYDQFKAKPVSEKALLAIIEPARRLMGWVLYSGSVYKITDFTHNVISSIKDSGTAYTEVSALGSLAAGKYYHDRDNQILYLQASDSSNPNSRYLVCVFKEFYCNGSGYGLPYDLSTGFAVYWQPLIKGTSAFGVRLDQRNQIGTAIEGSGSISFENDLDYWRSRYDKWSFDNKSVTIYSWSPILPITEAKKIYQGTIQGKAYTDKDVKFNLKDQLFELREEIALSTIGDISGALISDNLNEAKQRLLYGYIRGHRLTNIDQILDTGYALTGTASLTAGSATMTGSGTSFLSDLSPDDQFYITGITDPLVVADVVSDTEATLSEEATINVSGGTVSVVPDLPKRYANRDWVISGHALREPSTTVVLGDSPNLFSVADTTDFEIDSKILVGSEVVEVRRLVPTNRIKLKTNLLTTPSAGTVVKRFAVYNVRINGKLLTYSRDYTYNASTGRLTLDTEAELNIAPNRAIEGTISFAAASRTISGTNTRFTSQLTPNCWVRSVAESTYHEVLKIVSDTEAVLRAVPGFTENNATCLYKNPNVFDGDNDVLSCDCLGATDDGTTTGTFLKTAPQIVKNLIENSGVTASLDDDSFTEAQDIVHHKIGLVIPERYSDTSTPEYRKVIAKINKSVFGNIIQTSDFELQYHVFRPGRLISNANTFKEHDVLNWTIKADIDKIVKTVVIEYLFKEYDYTVDQESKALQTFSSNAGQYLAESKNTYTHETLLIDSTAAQTMAQRWAYLLSSALTSIEIKTKLQASRLQISDIIDFFHEKLYHRIASNTARKIGAVTAIEKDMTSSKAEFEDMANAFSRCAIITADGSNNYDDSTDDERFYHGFITDTYGMQDNDPDTHGVNLIW